MSYLFQVLFHIPITGLFLFSELGAARPECRASSSRNTSSGSEVWDLASLKPLHHFQYHFEVYWRYLGAYVITNIILRSIQICLRYMILLGASEVMEAIFGVHRGAKAGLRPPSLRAFRRAPKSPVVLRSELPSIFLVNP